MTQIKIAVSACLLGHNVRYDGNNKHIALEKYFNPAIFELVAICPEVEMGLSIPRPAIQIIYNKGIRLVQVDQIDKDYTQQMESWFKNEQVRLTEFSGFILKSRSPSCGYQSTIHFHSEKKHSIGNGIFVELLAKQIKQPAIIDEQKLNQIHLLQNFIKKITP